MRWWRASPSTCQRWTDRAGGGQAEARVGLARPRPPGRGRGAARQPAARHGRSIGHGASGSRHGERPAACRPRSGSRCRRRRPPTAAGWTRQQVERPIGDPALGDAVEVEAKAGRAPHDGAAGASLERPGPRRRRSRSGRRLDMARRRFALRPHRASAAGVRRGARCRRSRRSSPRRLRPQSIVAASVGRTGDGRPWVGVQPGQVGGRREAGQAVGPGVDPAEDAVRVASATAATGRRARRTPAAARTCTPTRPPIRRASTWTRHRRPRPVGLGAWLARGLRSGRSPRTGAVAVPIPDPSVRACRTGAWWSRSRRPRRRRRAARLDDDRAGRRGLARLELDVLDRRRDGDDLGCVVVAGAAEPAGASMAVAIALSAATPVMARAIRFGPGSGRLRGCWVAAPSTSHHARRRGPPAGGGALATWLLAGGPAPASRWQRPRAGARRRLGARSSGGLSGIRVGLPGSARGRHRSSPSSSPLNGGAGCVTGDRGRGRLGRDVDGARRERRGGGGDRRSTGAVVRPVRSRWRRGQRPGSARRPARR